MIPWFSEYNDAWNSAKRRLSDQVHSKINIAGIIEGAGVPWWNTSFAFRRKITIDHTKVGGALNNFPVLINITEYDLTEHVKQANGNDIVFIDRMHMMKYSHQIEFFNHSTGRLIAWIKIPMLSHLIDAVFYMYYGNATCVNQQNPSGVWDTYFHGVWHLNESSGSTSDSTSYSNDGTVYNSPQYNVAGKIAGAMQFDGDLFSGDYISCGDPVDGSLDFGTGDFTIECWVKTTQEDWVSLIHKIDITDAGPEGYALCMEDGKLFALLAENNALHILDVGKKFIADGQWHHIAVVFDRDIEATYYIDGTVDTGTKISMWTGSTSNTLPFWIARQYDGFNKYFLGTMDEIRVSNSTRSQAWVNTSYRNQNSTSTFYTVGDPTTRYFTVSIENIGTINHNTEGFVLLINGTIYQCTSDSHYLFPLNTIHIYTTTRIASGAKKIKVITDNGIEDEYNYTGAGGVE